jgi:tetratricopeptide (TPR) repeat protein
LGSLGSVACDQGDYTGGRKFYEQSLTIAREIGDRAGEGSALTDLGEALTGLGNLDEAATTLQQAIALRRDLGQQTWLMRSLAALARAFLIQGESAQALTLIEEVLVYLSEGGNLDGVEKSLKIDLTCYQALSVNRDSRATEILQTAHDRLQERAARIPDEKTRCMFLNNIPWHREILAAYCGEALPPTPATVPVHAEPEPQPEAHTNAKQAESPSAATVPPATLEETRVAPVTGPLMAEETKSTSEPTKKKSSQKTTRKKKRKNKKKKKRKKIKQQQQAPIVINLTIEQVTIVFKQDDS